MVNKRALNFGTQSSIIRQLFEYGKKRKKEIGAENVFDFSIGNPNVATPDCIHETLIDLLTNFDRVKLHSYTVDDGEFEVRESIAAYLNETYHTSEKAENIYLTCGASAGITIALHALIETGDEVIVLVPYFPEYKVFIEGANGKCIEVLCDPTTFLPDLDALNKAITVNTKLIIINSPNNPTGVVYSEETILSLANFLKKKETEIGHAIYLLSDEPYRELIYTKQVYPFVTKYYPNTLVTYSFSKSLSLPGERIGYLLLGSGCENLKELIPAINGAGRELGYECAPSLFQFLIPHCLGVTSNIQYYENNKNILMKALKEYGYEFASPDGAFYLYMKCLEEDSMAFMEKAKKFELLLVPSDTFGSKGYVRIAYCVSSQQILNSLEAFKKLYESYKR